MCKCTFDMAIHNELARFLSTVLTEKCYLISDIPGYGKIAKQNAIRYLKAIIESDELLPQEVICKRSRLNTTQGPKVRPVLNELLADFSSNCGLDFVIEVELERGTGWYLRVVPRDKSSERLTLDDVRYRLSEAKAQIEARVQAEEERQRSAHNGQDSAPPAPVKNLEDVLPLRLYETAFADPQKNQTLLDFRRRMPRKLYGRFHEEDRLNRFLLGYPDQKLLLWSITGKGGTGKSRLALELCHRFKTQGWHTGFLRDASDWEKWKDCIPTKPILIIVDYTHGKSHLLGRYVDAVVDTIEKWPEPVRILFLERSAKSTSFTNFTDISLPTINEDLRYSTLKDAGETDSLELEGLGDESVDAIVNDMYCWRTGEKAPAKVRQKVRTFLSEKVKDSTPLYAMIFAEALLRGENADQWNLEDLLNAVTTHYKHIWRDAGISEEDEIGSKHINLLTLATMTNGVDISSDKYVECLNDVSNKHGSVVRFLPSISGDDFDGMTYAVLTDYQDSEEQAPLIPDLLGEYFVLRQWRETVPEQMDRLKLLTRSAWKYNSRANALFLARMCSDFPRELDYDHIAALLDAHSSTLDLVIVLTSMIVSQCEANAPAKAEKLFCQLENLWKNGNIDDCHVSLAYVQAAFNLLTCYSAKQYPKQHCFKAADYYDLIADVWLEYYQKDWEITYVFAQAAHNLMYFLRNFEHEVDRMVRCTETLEALWGGAYPRDNRILLLMIKAETVLTQYCAELYIPRAVHHFHRFRELCNGYHPKDRELLLEQIYASNNIALYYCNIEEPDKAIRHFKRINHMCASRNHKDVKIYSAFARACCNMVYGYSKVRNLEKAKEYYTILDELCREHYRDNEEFSVYLAKALVSLCRFFGEREQYELWKSRFISLYEKFPDNEEMNTIKNAYFNE